MDLDLGDKNALDSENITTSFVDPECAGVEPPDLSKVSVVNLLHIKSKMDREGFTMDLGILITPTLSVSVTLFTFAISAKEISRVFYPEPYCNFVKSAPTVS